MNDLTMNSKQLAETLGISETTVKQYSYKSPQKLPPRLHTGIRGLLWLKDTVLEWLKASEARTVAATQAKQAQLILPSDGHVESVKDGAVEEITTPIDSESIGLTIT